MAPEALHVTLVFLGYLPEKEIATVASAAFAALADLAPPRLAVWEVRAVPPRDPVALAEGVLAAFGSGRDPALRARAAEFARPRIAGRVVELYRSVLDG